MTLGIVTGADEITQMFIGRGNTLVLEMTVPGPPKDGSRAGKSISATYAPSERDRWCCPVTDAETWSWDSGPELKIKPLNILLFREEGLGYVWPSVIQNIEEHMIFSSC